MQKVKFEQEKRRCLHDFMRTTRDKLLKEGKERRERENAQRENGDLGLVTQKSDLPGQLLATYQSFSSGEQRASPDSKKREEEMNKLKGELNEITQQNQLENRGLQAMLKAQKRQVLAFQDNEHLDTMSSYNHVGEKIVRLNNMI